MEKGDEFFYKIIEVLHRENILEHLLLAGGWCQRLYRYYYDNPREISALRTADIDFIIKRPIKKVKKSDVKELLNQIGFEEEFSFPQGYIKYTHPDLEIEFLVSEIGISNCSPDLSGTISIKPGNTMVAIIRDFHRNPMATCISVSQIHLPQLWHHRRLRGRQVQPAF